MSRLEPSAALRADGRRVSALHQLAELGHRLRVPLRRAARTAVYGTSAVPCVACALLSLNGLARARRDMGDAYLCRGNLKPVPPSTAAEGSALIDLRHFVRCAQARVRACARGWRVCVCVCLARVHA
jgi:hypothetical protein